MKSIRNFIYIVIATLLVSGCSRDDFSFSKIASTTLSNFGDKIGDLSLSGIGEQIGIGGDPKIKLAPAPLPIYAVGDTFVYSSDGKLVQEQVVSATGERVTWTNDQGMIWTTTNDLVTPPMSWSSHPELGRGRQTIIGNPKALYPLEKGNKVAFGTRGNSENLPTGWRNKEICLVIGQKDISVTAGDFTTFHISCKRKDHTEDLYYAPVAQNYVLRVRKFANNRSQKELVSVNLGNDRTKTLPVKITRPFKERKGLLKKVKVRSKTFAKMGTPSSGNPEVDALIARLEAMITRFEKVSNNAKIGTKKVKVVSRNKGKYGIHLASYRTVKGAQKGWGALKRKFPRELKNLNFGTTEFDAGKRKGTFVRLMGLSFQTKKSANKFCVRLKSKRQYCKGERVKP